MFGFASVGGEERRMKNWSGKSICFECAKKLGANINIGRQFKGRCNRCHSEQTLFNVTEVPVTPPMGEDVCAECAHPVGTHAASCRRSELELLKRERAEIVSLLAPFGKFDPEKSLAEQLREALRQAQEGPR
jgi:hypothetical protein